MSDLINLALVGIVVLIGLLILGFGMIEVLVPRPAMPATDLDEAARVRLRSLPRS